MRAKEEFTCEIRDVVQRNGEGRYNVIGHKKGKGSVENKRK
jgi:hypothetical protein